MPTIKSNSDPDDSRPWYDVVVASDGRPEIAADKDGGTPFDMTGKPAVSPSWSDAPKPPARAMQSDVLFGVTTTGEFISWTPGTDLADHGISLRAHLARYDAETDTFDLWEFVEETA